MNGKAKLLKEFEERKEEFSELVASVGVATMLLNNIAEKEQSDYYKLVFRLCGLCSHLISAYGYDELWND